MKDVFKNKRLWIGIGCGVLVIALIIGIILMTGGNGNQSDPTNPTTEPVGTTAGGDVTDPSDVTDPTVTNPANPSEPDPTIPTGTPDNPGQDDEPLKPDDYTEPVDPEPTIPEPTDPEPDVDAPEPTDDPDIGPAYDFEGYTMGTITAEVWETWDITTQGAFVRAFYNENTTPEEYHHFMVQTMYGGYTCGFEKHTCTSDDQHEWFMGELADGCVVCGSSECPSFFTVNPQTLFIHMDITACPMYDIHNDPQFYCQTCGLPTLGESGDVCCHKYIADATCSWCGEPVKAHQCHECIQP